MTFTYNYSAATNKEVEAIRRKYLPKEESKLEALKRLDRKAQSAGVAQALAVGVVGCLIFGLGMCMALKTIGGGLILGVIAGIVGTCEMMLAYPIFKMISQKTKAELAPEILKLADELSHGADKNSF